MKLHPLATSTLPLISWAIARENMRLRKEAKKFPYSEDPILTQFRFTNVRRRDDRVSRWLQQNVLVSDDSDELIVFSALCRWINWPPTIKALMDKDLHIIKSHDDLVKVGTFLDAIQGKVWTGAYMVRAKPFDGGARKGAFVAQQVIGPVLDTIPHIREMLALKLREAAWNALNDLPNWGPFMAGQVIDDWTWTPLLTDPTDQFTFAPPGPGSSRGYNRLLDIPLKNKVNYTQWAIDLPIIRQQVIGALNKYFHTRSYLDVTAMDIQNCMCEYDKYERVRLGEGRPRALYHPETAF